MFRDEDLAYALRLGQAGVPVEFHLHPGAPHQFDFIAFNTTGVKRDFACTWGWLMSPASRAVSLANPLADVRALAPRRACLVNPLPLAMQRNPR